MNEDHANDAQAAEVEWQFSTILHRLEDGETIALDELCRSRPDLAPRLQQRFGDWSIGRAAHHTPSKANAPGEAGSSGAWALFLDQLRSRGPAWRRYDFQSIVGKGGMGIVHRVFDRDARRSLALKVLRDPTRRDGGSGSGRGNVRVEPASPATHDETTLGRFLEEARVTAQLDHPNIVPVHEIGLDDRGRVYFTMKLVKGDDLRRVFEQVAKREGGWTLARTIEILLKVCDAMSYAHAKAVIHRDLKPGNVMVGGYGEVYVMDWGLAHVSGAPDHRDLRIRPRDESADGSSVASGEAPPVSEDAEGDGSPIVTMDGDVVGTPSYMPPEQARGALDELGPWSDVYAVGAMLYHLLAGAAPYQATGSRRSAYEILGDLADGPPPPILSVRPDADPELVAICAKAMQRDRSLRYPTMTGLAADLRAWTEHRVVPVYESGLLAEMRKWIQRNRALAATVAIATVLFAVLAVTAYFRIHDERDIAVANEQRATENATLAERRRVEAERDRQKVQWVLNDVRIGDLKKRWATLWPAEPAMAPRFEEWLASARELLALRTEYAAKVAELADLAPRGASANGGSPTAGGASSIPTPDDAEWWRAQASGFLAALAELERDDPWQPTIASVKRRLEFARTIEARSLREPATAWSATVDAIANSPLYGGLRIGPQLGLVPLGPDPTSGYFEFAHLQSGAIPQRDPVTGPLRIDADSAIVFVLLPGGTFYMGAQRDYPDESNFDPDAEAPEEPVEPIRLEPFFLAKYETTQGQWRRLAGTNPSHYQAGRPFAPGEAIDDRHPVETVTHAACTALARELGMRVMIPTEAQWEYACRGGTTTPWWTGADKRDLEAGANLADSYFHTRGVADNAPFDGDLDDGFACHAPVGSLRANGFGLHDVIGNVREWCRDTYHAYSAPTAGGDAERSGSWQEDRVYRGGCFDGLPVHSRCAHRDYKPASFAADYIGIRFARTLDR